VLLNEAAGYWLNGFVGRVASPTWALWGMMSLRGLGRIEDGGQGDSHVWFVIRGGLYGHRVFRRTSNGWPNSADVMTAICGGA